MCEKEVIGLTEKIDVFSKDKSRRVFARIDTGAATSSIDVALASALNLGPILKVKSVKSSLGKDKRPVVRVNVRIKHLEVSGYFTVADRGHMKYPVLIGRNILRKIPVFIDPSIKNTANRLK